MLLFVSALKLVAEIALMAFLGQWLLGLLAGPRRNGNFFYELLKSMTRPFVAAARLVSPRQVLDRHLPLVAALLLMFIWIGALLAKIDICLSMGPGACR